MPREAKPMSLAEVIYRLQDGGTVEEIQEKIRTAIQAARETGKKAKVTITLEFQRNGDQNSRKVIVTDTVKATIPDGYRDATMLFATDEGDLTTTNPDQGMLEGV